MSPLPPGLTIHREKADDAARRLLESAFGQEGRAIVDLVTALESSVHHRDVAFVARRGGEPVGYVLLSRAWVDAPSACSTSSSSARWPSHPSTRAPASAPR